MEKQNFKNHKRLAPKSYYTGILLALLIMLISILYNKAFSQGWNNMLLPFSMICLSIGLIIIGWYARAFALKAQDRAIRAEENLRYYALTGKMLDKALNLNQIIALRFASDEELVELVQKAVDKKLSNMQIKLEIKNWRSDMYRV